MPFKSQERHQPAGRRLALGSRFKLNFKHTKPSHKSRYPTKEPQRCCCPPERQDHCACSSGDAFTSTEKNWAGPGQAIPSAEGKNCSLFFPEPHSHRQGKGTNIYPKHLPGLGKGGVTSKGETSDTAEPQLDVSTLSPAPASAMVSNWSTSSALLTLCQRWHRSRSQSLGFNKGRALLLPNSHLGCGGMLSKLDFGS